MKKILLHFLTLIVPAICFTQVKKVVIPSVTIGSQIWSNKNLNVDKYRNGDPIPQVQDEKEWESLKTGAWCYYNNNPANGAIYGKLYNWYAVNDPRGLAPQGWHIPSQAEWNVLYEGREIEELIENGTAHWVSLNGANNKTGFSILPGGERHYGSYYGMGELSSFWTTDVDSRADWKAREWTFGKYVVGDDVDKTTGCYVRIISDKSNSNNYSLKQSNSTNTQSNNPNSTTYEKRSSTQENNSSSNDCDKIIEDYLVFAREAIAYYNRIKKNLRTTSFSEYSNWDLEIRKQQSIVNKCVDKDISYGIKILDVMNELATAIASFSGKSSNSFTSNNNSNSSSNNTPNSKKVCRDCRCPDEEGWYISDFNPANKTYPNGRYVLRPGYIKCDACQGTGDCRNLKSQYPTIWCENGYTCKQCHGERFVICKSCKGSGYSK
jgi:uncharacterized protein (TIGR02145 family)